MGDIAKLSVSLIVSRLGDVAASLIYFSFVGNFIVESLSQASLAWALVSFLTVVGVGFFLNLLIKIAGSTDLNTGEVGMDINVCLRYAILLGFSVVVGVFIYVSLAADNFASIDRDVGLVLLIFSCSVPAIYVQMVVFNFFNAVKQARWELFFTWLFNAAIVVMAGFLIREKLGVSVVYFTFCYVVLRWIFVCVLVLVFNRKVKRYIDGFCCLEVIPAKRYVEYFSNAFPLVLCFSGESLLYLVLSLVSKNLGATSLFSYQASLSILIIVYMISIGVGNATGIVVAHYNATKNHIMVRRVWAQGVRFGLILLIPFLLIFLFFREYVSLIYTSDIKIREMIEENLLISIPFLLFEYIYVVTRAVLRNLGDFWVPTLLTVTLLSVLGAALSMLFVFFYKFDLRSIFVILVFCSFLLMVCLIWRLERMSRVQVGESC